MKRFIIEPSKIKDFDLIDYFRDDAYFKVMDEYNIMESHIVYFSAGDAKIKEILIKKDPSYSA